MGRKHSTRFITDESQVPDGYVPLASFGHNTTIHRALCDAHRDGRVRAVKLVRHEGDVKTGAVWVHGVDADEFQRNYGKPCVKQTQQEQRASTSEDGIAALQAALTAIATNQVSLLRAVERLADAAESIATQPLARLDDVAIPEPSGSWRDMNGEAH